MKRPSHSTCVAYLALFFAMSGTAAAATGGTFILGKANTQTSTASLSNSNGTPLSLGARAGTAPLAVNSSVKVNRLNADLIDGIDGRNLQARVAGTCPTGSALSAVNANGTVVCVSTNNPAIEEKAQYSDRGFAVSSITLEQSAHVATCWSGRARLTNNGDAVRGDVRFTLTYLADQEVMAVVRGQTRTETAFGPGETVNVSLDASCNAHEAFAPDRQTAVMRVEHAS